MTNEQTCNIQLNWSWQDYVSTYRFWGVVLASFLIACSAMAAGNFIFQQLSRQGLSPSSIGPIYSLGSFGNFFGALLVLYFLRNRVKIALIIFSLLVAVSIFLLYSGLSMEISVLVFLQMCLFTGATGFTITVVVALISGRPNIGSFVIVYSVVIIWIYIARMLSVAFMGFLFNVGYPWAAGIPALLAILVLIPMSGKMFSEEPEALVLPTQAIKREPFVVFLFSSFIPFYFLVWLFKRPGELKTLAPDMQLPSRAGMLCTSLFAPFIIPLWFHDVRKELAEKLPGRSAKLMGVISFFFPTIGAAMAQSDNNQIASTSRTIIKKDL